MEQLNLDLFADRLPVRPYCTDDLNHGLKIRPRATALQHRYIQPNPPSQRHCLVFDVDREGAAFAAEDAGLPHPNRITISPNGHAHLVYFLKDPICTSSLAELKPLRYAAAVEEAILTELSADPGYSGLITKNPTHPHWKLYQPHDHLYSLFDLAVGLDLRRGLDKRRTLKTGLGRNVTLFDRLRQWAYRNVDEYRPHDLKGWFKAVRDRASEINDGAGAQADSSGPLPANEVRDTAKSVARWTWTKFFKAESDARFSKKQAARARIKGEQTEKFLEQTAFLFPDSTTKELAGLTGKSVRTVKRYRSQAREVYLSDLEKQRAKNQQKAISLFQEGKTRQEIADILKVSKRTVQRWNKGAVI